MSTINFDGSCANCRRKPVAFGIPVLKNPAVEGQGGHNIDIWCIDCVRRLLHQEGEDEVVVGDPYRYSQAPGEILQGVY